MADDNAWFVTPQQRTNEAAAIWDPRYAWGLHSGAAAPGKYAPGARTLYDILDNPGQTDATMFNRGITANARQTQRNVDATKASYARSGLGGSSLAKAMMGAAQGAGADREADMRAVEARRKEDLKRQDLQLLYQFILEPSMQRYAAERGVSLGQSQLSAQKTGAGLGALGSIIGGLAMGGVFGCFAADELYGADSTEAALARVYMIKYADDETRRIYNPESSKVLAARIRRDPALRAEVKPIFDSFVEHVRAQ